MLLNRGQLVIDKEQRNSLRALRVTRSRVAVQEGPGPVDEPADEPAF